MSVVLIIRRFWHAAQKVWKAGRSCAHPMKVCQILLVPEMGKEFPELAASQLAWGQLVGQLQHCTTQCEFIYPLKSILLTQFHLITNWF